MASTRTVLVAGCTLALAVAGGVGYFLLRPAPGRETGTGGAIGTTGETPATASGNPVETGGQGGVLPPKGPVTPVNEDEDPNDREPSGPDGGFTTEDILAAAAKGDWQAVESMLRTSGSEDPRVTDAIAKGLGDDRWRPMILQLAQFLKDPGAAEKFLSIARGEGNENTRAAAIQAAGFVGGREGPEGAAAARAVLEAAQEILRTAKPGGMLSGCTLLALGSLGTPEAARVLVGLLRERLGTPGSAAVLESLSRIHSPGALTSLGEMLNDAESPAPFRAALAEALGKTRDPAVVNDLLRTVRDTEDEGLRNACYRSLAMVGSPEAVHELLQVVAGADNGRRLEAAQALAGVTNKTSAAFIEEALKSPVDPVLRGYLVTAVGRTGGRTSLEFLDGLAGSSSEEEGIRRTAVKAMGDIGDAAASPLITNILERTPRTEENKAFRIQCLDSLTGIVRPEERVRLAKMLEDTPANTPEWIRLRTLVAASAERFH